MLKPTRVGAVCLLALSTGCMSGGSDGSASTGTDGTVPGFPGGSSDPMPGAVMSCYYGPNPAAPAAAIEQVIEQVGGVDALHVRLTLDPAFVDNSYGATAIGWSDRKKGHSFEELVKSDRAELVFTDAGSANMDLMVDYVSTSAASPSGYGSLGVVGGEGQVMQGDPSAILASSTSLDRNLNERGYGDYLVDSPPTDDQYTPSAEAPDWDYRVVYEVWVATSAIGAGAVASVDYIHASPSKAPDDTVVVDPDPCPPDWGCQNPDGCGDGGGDGGGQCDNPDGCGDGGGDGGGQCDNPDGCGDGSGGVPGQVE